MKIREDWLTIIKENYDYKALLDLVSNIDNMRAKAIIYPDKEDVFNFLNFTSFEDIKVVIIGQDPYYNQGEANGLAFSVNPGMKLPPSLRNIYKELYSDTGIDLGKDGSLIGWAKQGVFLINSTLTVEAKKPNSHSNLGWDNFTDFLIKYISDNKENVVFVLWGNFAIKKERLIDESRNMIIKSSHPSPLSARHSFFGSRVFSKTNSYLKSKGLEEIDWSRAHDY